jgi:hypothetical protein
MLIEIGEDVVYAVFDQSFVFDDLIAVPQQRLGVIPVNMLISAVITCPEQIPDILITA